MSSNRPSNEPSLGRDAVLDAPLFVLKAFDRLPDHTTTIERDHDCPVSEEPRRMAGFSNRGSTDAFMYYPRFI